MTGARIAKSAALIMLGNIGSRVLGLAREQTIAALFGTSATASLFSAVSRVPTLVYDLLVGGAITSALIPVFSELAGRDERREDGRSDRLQTITGAVLLLALAVLTPCVLVLMALARPLMGLLGVGFAPDVQEQGVLLTRVALPSVAMLGAAAVLMAALYALQRVTLPSFAAAAYNTGIIVCALALTPMWGVTGLVAGLVVGAALQLGLQLFGLRDHLPLFSSGLTHPALPRILRLYAPVAGGLVVSALVVILDTRLASLTGEESLAAMRFATQVVQLPLGLVATALSFAVLPVLSRYGSSGSTDPGFARTLAAGVRAALLLIVPMTVVLVMLRDPVIRLLFGRGEFGAVAVARTSEALLYYAPQLPFVAVDQILIAAFYALQNTKLPVLVGVFGAGLYVTVALATVQLMGMTGLVLANSIQNSAHAVVLFIFLMWRHPAAVPAGLASTTARVLAGAVAMACVLLVTERVNPYSVEALPLAIQAGLSIVLACAAYTAVLAVAGGEDVSLARRLVGSRFTALRGITGRGQEP